MYVQSRNIYDDDEFVCSEPKVDIEVLGPVVGARVSSFGLKCPHLLERATWLAQQPNSDWKEIKYLLTINPLTQQQNTFQQRIKEQRMVEF